MTAVAWQQHVLLRQQVEDFLYAEAALLDAWALDEWLQLFDADAKYEVPCNDALDADPAHDLLLIDDNYVRLTARVARLNSRRAHRSTRTPERITRCAMCGCWTDQPTRCR